MCEICGAPVVTRETRTYRRLLCALPERDASGRERRDGEMWQVNHPCGCEVLTSA